MTASVKQLYMDADRYYGKQIKVAGWIRTIRNSKTFGFIELNDGSFLKNLQVVFEEGGVENFKDIAKLPQGSSIKASGVLVETPGSKQPFEMKASAVEAECLCAPDYPLQKKRHSFEFMRTIAHLRPRTNTFSAVFRLRSVLSYAIHSFFNEKGFVYVHTPIITSSDCEGAGEMFRVTTLNPERIPKDEKGLVDYRRDFFGREAGLTVSGQLTGEAYCMAFGKIYTFGPTFRAENSNTARHAAEFWMVEPEMAFAGLDENMALAEEMLKYLVNYCFEYVYEELEFFNRFIDNTLLDRLKNVSVSKFEHITYTEAIELMEKEKAEFDYPVKWGYDLQTEHERYLTEEIFKGPVFVTDYPKEIKAFYMRLNDDGKTVAAMDLLVPEVGEIIGGSQREERYDVLKKRMEEMGIDKKDYWWYLDLRKYGGAKHAGFGMGFERALMYLSGMQNIRDVIPFPRTPKSVDF